MNRSSLLLRIFTLCLFFGTSPFCSLQSIAQTQISSDKITIEGMYRGQFRDIATLPALQWCSDGSAVMLDFRQAASSRAFEKLDPASGKRTPHGDMAKIKANWKTLVGTDVVPFPSFNASGGAGFVEWGEDVHILNVSTAEWRSIRGVKEDCTRFSPDGKKIAFVRANDLYVYDIASSKETRLTTDGGKLLYNGTHSWVYWEEVYDRADEGYTWSADSKMIAFFQSDESPVSTVIFPDFKPVVPENIEQRYPKAGTANPKVRVGVLNIENPSAVRWVDFPTSGGYAGVEPKIEYIVRLKWLPDNKRLSVQTMNRAQTELTLHFADAATGKTTQILKETNDGWVNVHDDLYFLADNKHFLWASERTGYNHIYRYTLDGKLANQVTKGDWAAGGARATAIAAVDEKRGTLYFRALEKSSVERHLYKIQLDGSKMERLSEESGTHTVSMSNDGAFYTDNFSTLTTPPTLRLHKNDGKQVTVLAASRTDLSAKLPLQTPRIFTIPVSGGFAMPAQILTPRTFDSTKRYPVIIYVYGGPSAPVVQNGWQQDRDKYFYQMLSDEGYIIVKLDNRSCSGISKTYENTCVKDLAGDSEVNDLLAGVRWLKGQKYVDSSRIGMWGWSFGGAFTLQGMTRSKEFKAGIAVAAPSDWRYYDTKYTESFMKTPQENIAGYDKTNANVRAKDLSGRLLLVHGTYDDNVHPQNVWMFINELVKANKQFDLMMYPMRKHGISDAPARIHLYNLMFDFWKKNL
ncbi:MAG: S9 family peptidase [Candidatus Kapaibacterium sp.]|nr:MAG: S9 family peptidase [Candidatus Kapabacteria bacterium]